MINQSNLPDQEQKPGHTLNMTLDQYLFSMQTLPKNNMQKQQKVQQDLYQTSRQVSKKKSKRLITFQIRQSDQDNYDQSVEQKPRKIKQNAKNHKQLYKQDNIGSNKNIFNKVFIDEEHTEKERSADFRIRRQSNSPFKQAYKQVSNFSPNKMFSHTLHTNNPWRIHKEPHQKVESSSVTIYGKFMRGVKQANKQINKLNDKQKHFKKKNTQQIEHLVKYQKDIFQKYDKLDIINMRIDGIQDRLCERKYVNVIRKTKS